MKTTKTPYEQRAWRLVILCWLAYTTVYIGKKTLSVCLSDIIADGICDSTTGGGIGTAFLACYAAGQFLCGWIGERVHPRNMICGGLFLAGCMDIGMSLAGNALAMTIIWGACGIFCSMLWAPIIRAVSTWTSEEIGQSAGASLSVTIPVGTILCYAICAATLRFGSWRWSFAVCGIVLCAAAALLYIAFLGLRSHTVVAPRASAPASSVGEAPVPRSNVRLFCLGLVLAALCILCNGMIKDGLDLWIPTVLRDRFIDDGAVVSAICTILPLVNIVGVYAASWLHARFRMAELTVCAVMFVISTVSLGGALALIHTAASGIAAGIAATVCLALSSAAMLGANSMLLTFVPLHFGKIGRAAALTGMLNCFSYAAAAVSGLAVGFVLEKTSWETVALIFAAVAAVGGLIALLGVKPLGRKIREAESASHVSAQPDGEGL